MLLLGSCFQVTPALQDNAQNTVHLEINYTVTVAACEQACVNCSRTLADKNQLGPAQPHGPGWTQPGKILKKILLKNM